MRAYPGKVFECDRGVGQPLFGRVNRLKVKILPGVNEDMFMRKGYTQLKGINRSRDRLSLERLMRCYRYFYLFLIDLPPVLVTLFGVDIYCLFLIKYITFYYPGDYPHVILVPYVILKPQKNPQWIISSLCSHASFAC